MEIRPGVKTHDYDLKKDRTVEQTSYIIIIQGYNLTNLNVFLNQEQIMVYLILDFKGLKYGILLIVKSRPHLWLFLKKNLKFSYIESY